MTTPTAQPGPDGYGIVTPEPITGTVAIRQPGTAAATGAQRPKAELIDGALLWALINRYLAHYVAFRTAEELNRVTAWVFHASARRRGELGMGPLIWNASPRLLIKSRTRGAGKSTALRLITALTGSSKTPRITAARFAQLTGQAYETVCIDEGRLILGAGARQEDLQACLLDGYTPGTFYQVSKTKLSLFGAVAFATKESLITDATKAVDGDESSIGDLLDRCLTVTLTRPEFPMPEVGKRAEADGALLCRALIAWTDTCRDALEQAAEDIASEDYEAAQARARAREKQTETPRALQIGRPLRAVGRVIDQQVIAEARRTHRLREHGGRECDCPGGFTGPEPQCEAEILACLGTQAEDIMAELQGLSQGWGDAQFTDNAGEDDEWIASTSDPGDYEDAPAPAGQYQAGYGKTRPGKPAVHAQLDATWATLAEAQQACEDDSGGPLHWEQHGQLWTATVYESGGTEVAYAISAAGE